MKWSKTAAVLAALALTSTVAYGVQIKMSLEEISQTADLIFVGTVASKSGVVNDKKTSIDTVVTFTDVRVVTQSEKSVQRDPNRIRLTYAGGTVGDRTLEVSDTPEFATGRRYLVFMNDDGPKYLNPVIGGFQGQFQVVRDAVTGLEYVLTASGRAITSVSDAGEIQTTARRVTAISGGAAAFAAVAVAGAGGVGAEADPVGVDAASQVAAAADASAMATADSRELMTLDAFVDHVTTVSMKKAVEHPVTVREGTGTFFRDVNGAVVAEAIKESAPHVVTLDDRYAAMASRLVPRARRADGAAASAIGPAGLPPITADGASLFYCGYRSRPFSMEQVPATWWEWNVNNDNMWTWNQYVDLFRYTTSNGTFAGGNGVSEFDGYPSSATLNSQYGYTWGGSTLAVTFTYTSVSCGFISESDVAWNPARSWTNNYLYAFNNSAVVNLYPVNLHELGHTHGLQRGGETYDYDYVSVMHAYYYNVAEDGWGVHASDASNTRANYGSSTNVSDIGVESYYASNGLHNAYLSGSSFTPGSGITGYSQTVENMSQFALGNVHIRYYVSTDRTINTADRLAGDWSWTSFGGNAQWVGNLTGTIPSNTPPGTYWLGALMTINGYAGDGYGANNATFFPASFTVTCSGVFSVSPTSRSVLKTGVSTSVSVVTSASACPWSAYSTNTAWLHVTSGASGTGAGTVYYTVDANSSTSSRSAYVVAGGAYHLVSQEAGCSGATPTPIGFWSTRNGSLATTDCLSDYRVVGGTRPYEDKYTFTGSANQKVAIALSSPAFDTYVYLVGPGGTVVAQDDDGGSVGGNSRIPAVSGTYTLPTAGLYTIAVTSYSTGATGAYSLTLVGSISLAVSPAIATGSCDAVKGTVTLGTKAPAGFTVLLSDTLAAATMPATVVVPANGNKGTFNITTSMVAALQSGNVSASAGGADGVSATDTLNVAPIYLKTFVVNPASVVGGHGALGTMTLECNAGAGGVTVALASSRASTASPASASVTIPAGSKTATVAINTSHVTKATSVTIKATTGGKTKSDKLAVNP